MRCARSLLQAWPTRRPRSSARAAAAAAATSDGCCVAPVPTRQDAPEPPTAPSSAAGTAQGQDSFIIPGSWGVSTSCSGRIECVLTALYGQIVAHAEHAQVLLAVSYEPDRARFDSIFIIRAGGVVFMIGPTYMSRLSASRRPQEAAIPLSSTCRGFSDKVSENVPSSPRAPQPYPSTLPT